MAGSEVSLGVEIDGATACAALVRDGVAVAVFTAQAASGTAAFADVMAQARRHKQAKAVKRTRVALVNPSISLRRLDVSAALRERAAFEDAAYTALPVSRDGTTVAGLFADLRALAAGGLSAGVAVVAPAGPVAETYQAAGRPVEVVAPAVSLNGQDGLWVGIRRANTDVTLVRGGTVQAHRSLRAGGLDEAASRAAGPDTERAAAILTAALERRAASVGAEDDLAAWLRQVATEVRATGRHWASQGEPIPPTVYVFGAASALEQLPEHFADLAVPVEVSAQVRRAVAQLPAHQQAAASGAVLAALSAGDQMPQAAFPDPAAAIAMAREQTRRVLRRRVAGVGAAALLLAGAAGGPVAYGQLQLTRADTAHTAAKARLARVAGAATELNAVDTLNAQYSGERGTSLDWAKIVGLAYGVTPPGATVTNLSSYAQTGDVTDTVSVAVSASFPGSYATLTAWLSRLMDQPGVTDAWPVSFAQVDGLVQASVTFNVATAGLHPATGPAPAGAAAGQPGVGAAAGQAGAGAPTRPVVPPAVRTPPPAPSTPAAPQPAPSASKTATGGAR